jgi:hypothetical protein
MPHYFLDVRNGSDLLEDQDGQELGDLAAARQEALEAARELMAEDLRNGAPLCLDRVMVLADEKGHVGSEIPFGSALTREQNAIGS